MAVVVSLATAVAVHALILYLSGTALLNKWEEYEVAGFFVFSHIRMMSYFRLCKVKVNECPAGLGNWPRRG